MQHRKTLLTGSKRAAESIALAVLLLVISEIVCAQPSEPPPSTPSADVSDPADAAEKSAIDGQEEPTEPEEKLPTLEEMELPTAEQLLRSQRVDWVVLKRFQEVIVTEPVTPRPDTLNKMQQAVDEKSTKRGKLTGEALDKFRQELDALSKIQIHLPDQTDEADYLLPMKLVEQIIHHEDLMLRRIDVLIKEQNFDLAYELLNILRRETPDWPGALDRHQSLLMAEARRKVAREQYESALATYEEIYSRTPQFSGLEQRVGEVVDLMVERAVAVEDWRQARHYRRRLEELYPAHPTAEIWKSQLINAAEQQLTAAAQARTQGDHRLAVSHAELAAVIWPAGQNLRARYRSYADRYQRLHVGVLNLPTGSAVQSVVKSQADERADRLSEIRFFEVDHADDGTAHYSTRFCDRWEPLNLGREVLFELRDSRQPWEGQPVIMAPVIAGQIAARLDPSHPAYDERLAGYARSVDVHSPYSFTLNFDRVPVRVESLLTIPVLHAGTGQELPSSDDKTSPVSLTTLDPLTGGFQLGELTSDRAVYRRALPEPEDLRLYHLSEIQEHRYADSDAALQALLRGEVSMLVRPPAWIVDLLRSDEQQLKSYFVEKMSVPVTHVVQMNPNSQPLKNREYRRALAYAIDRRRILTETVLRNRADDLGRVVDGPLPSRSDANSALVRTREYDPLSAISLSLAARKQLGGELPPLRMVVIDDPIVREAAHRLAESWARFGIEVQLMDLPAGPLVTDDGSEPAWDLLYRTVQLTEPVTQLWPFLTLTGRALVSDLDPFPDWLRQEIIDLDLASDWRTALQAVNKLHLHLWGEVMFLPLWEVDEFLIYRKNVRGVPVSPVHPYEDVDRWVVEAWYPEGQP